MSGEALRLIVGSTEAGWTFQLRIPAAREYCLTADASVTSAERWQIEDALTRLEGAVAPSPFAACRTEEARLHLKTLSELLRGLLPALVLGELERLAADGYRPLELETQPGLPWELCRLGAGRLSHSFFVSRVEPGYHPGAVRLVSSTQSRRALVVGDAEGLLPWSREEVDLVKRLLQPALAVDVLTGSEATPEAVRLALQGGRYGLVHLVSFLGEDSCYLAGGPLPVEALRPGTACPALCVLNLVPAPRPGQSPRELQSGAWIRALRAFGVQSVVATEWDVEPGASRAFSGALYRELAAGRPLFEAVGTARQELARGGKELEAEAYLAFGAWDLILDNLWPVQSGPSPTMESCLLPDFVLRVLEGPDEGLEVPLMLSVLEGGRPLVLGSPGPLPCDVEIEDPELENQAARLLVEGGGLCIEKTSGLVRVNGLAVRGRVPLEGWEIVELGSTRLRLERREPRTGGPSARGQALAPGRRYSLGVVQGREADLGQEVALRDSISVVGREAGCALQLHDPKVSRQHFSILLREGLPYLSHAGTNPTVLNGIPVSQEVRLQHGSLIQVGDTQLQFRDRERERR